MKRSTDLLQSVQQAQTQQQEDREEVAVRSTILHNKTCSVQDVCPRDDFTTVSQPTG